MSDLKTNLLILWIKPLKLPTLRHIPGLYIAISEKGRSVYTAELVQEEDIIEVCPMLLIPESERLVIHNTSLHDYYFIWPEGGIALALGYGSLYNHSREPNAEVIFDTQEHEMIVKALKSIDPGEEILIDYTDGNRNHKLWFNEKGPDQV